MKLTAKLKNMKFFRCDLHNHTVLSPCGDLEMSPVNIVKRAREQKIDILGITDHNTTLHASLVKQLGAREGIMVMMGAEVTSREEVHCLCFFEEIVTLECFQSFLEEHLPNILNDVNRFGYQVVVDEKENIVCEVEYLLISALNVGIEELEQKVHELGGLFIPAHIDRKYNGLISQLGFVPPDLKVDALELSRFISKEEFLRENGYLKNYTIIQSSDAHYIDNMGQAITQMYMESASFQEVRKALKGEDGRCVV